MFGSLRTLLPLALLCASGLSAVSAAELKACDVEAIKDLKKDLKEFMKSGNAKAFIKDATAETSDDKVVSGARRPTDHCVSLYANENVTHPRITTPSSTSSPVLALAVLRECAQRRPKPQPWRTSLTPVSSLPCPRCRSYTDADPVACIDKGWMASAKFGSSCNKWIEAELPSLGTKVQVRALDTCGNHDDPTNNFGCNDIYFSLSAFSALAQGNATTVAAGALPGEVRWRFIEEPCFACEEGEFDAVALICLSLLPS